jgi:hypothetical protein
LKKRTIILLTLCLALLINSACSPQDLPTEISKIFPFIVQPTRTPFQPVPPTPTPTISPTPTIAPTFTPEPVREVLAWADPSLPPAMKAGLNLPEGVRLVDSEAQANLAVGAIRGEQQLGTTWVYALVAPFPTLVDDVSLEDIRRAWRGEETQAFGSAPLRMSASTRAAFSAWWGPAAEGSILVEAEASLLENAWAESAGRSYGGVWAIVPFEDLTPRWKVLKVNGLSPLDPALILRDYPLALWFGYSGSQAALNLLSARLGPQGSLFPPGNRDTSKMTVLAMTGVTALARATASRMDLHGSTYPGRDIAEWLRNADLAHISNEVSFNPACPLANPMSTSLQFCSRPEYIELLDFIGTDIIELSGNHNNDYGREASIYSLELYAQRGWLVYAGGANAEEARQPRTIEHNGNRFAFIGCNPVGPPNAWATSDLPGAAKCDWGYMTENIERLRAGGYLPIVTIQYNEYYIPGPSETQERDFRRMSEAGAVIVSGSQAHFPQSMEFYGSGFIHYGLGNLFFDQMDIPVRGTRREFVDRHVFYNGQHISTELLTAMLEDYARPRPMTSEERQQFLSDIFAAGGWK